MSLRRQHWKSCVNRRMMLKKGIIYGSAVTLADGSGRTALQILSDRKKIRGEARLLAPLVKCLKAAGCPAQAGPDQDNDS